MNNYLFPVLIILSGLMIAAINLIFPSAVSFLMMVVAVIAAYSIVKINQN